MSVYCISFLFLSFKSYNAALPDIYLSVANDSHDVKDHCLWSRKVLRPSLPSKDASSSSFMLLNIINLHTLLPIIHQTLSELPCKYTVSFHFNLMPFVTFVFLKWTLLLSLLLRVFIKLFRVHQQNQDLSSLVLCIIFSLDTFLNLLQIFLYQNHCSNFIIPNKIWAILLKIYFFLQQINFFPFSHSNMAYPDWLIFILLQ